MHMEVRLCQADRKGNDSPGFGDSIQDKMEEETLKGSSMAKHATAKHCARVFEGYQDEQSEKEDLHVYGKNDAYIVYHNFGNKIGVFFFHS